MNLTSKTDDLEEVEQPWLSLSVTDLVHFSCRTGDLNAIVEAGPSAAEGIRVHQKIQKARQKKLESDYQAEVAVDATYIWNDQRVLLRGRIDGVQHEPVTVIEEIKSCYLPPSELPESVRSVQLAQLKVYAWLWIENHSLTSIETRLTWFDIAQNKEFSEDESYTKLALTDFVETALNIYCQWYFQVTQHRQKLKDKCRQLTFPFSGFRGGQRYFSEQLFRGIRDKKKVAINAPTGIGKSIGSLFPAFKAIGEGHIEQVVFLTAKTSGRRAALQAGSILQKQDVDAKILIVNAKGKTCFCQKERSGLAFNESARNLQTFNKKAPNKKSDSVEDNQQIKISFFDDLVDDSLPLFSGANDLDVEKECDFCHGFYYRLPDALNECFQYSILDVETLAEVAIKHHICPFELSMKMVSWVDIVIADFNYVFEPQTGLTHFREKGSQIACLIDEAHNLIDRSRNMYSAELDKKTIEVLSVNYKKERKFLSLAEEYLQVFSRYSANPDNISASMVNELIISVMRQMHWFSRRKSDTVLPADFYGWLKQLSRFRLIEEISAQHQYFFETDKLNQFSKTENSELIRLVCLNASGYLSNIYHNFRSVALFSGTLCPPEYIAHSLGLDNETVFHDIPSPFKSEQSLVLIPKFISTRFAERQQSIPKVTKAIKHFVEAKRGNYLVCFSSYQFMHQVIEILEPELDQNHLIKQTPDMNQEQRQEFIDTFYQQSNVIGFVVMGGTFTEGVDFIGDALHGVAIVGTGMPQVNAIQNAIKDNFTDNELNGFDMAYRFPGLQRILQTAGRVIRSDTDKGAILLLDKSFANSVYHQYFPEHWQPMVFSDSQEMTEQLECFWRR